MAEAIRDQNHITVALGVSSADSSVTLPITIDNVTGRLLTDATGAVGTVTSVSVASANGLAGTVATATSTPAITLSTSITGVLLGNGTAISAAVNSDLPVMTATVGGAVPTPPNNTTDFLRGDGTFAAPAGAGTVTSVSVVTANGVSGSVATATSTPAITLTLGAITPSGVTVSDLTASELVATDASKGLESLAVATYPSLTEISYVKGLTSAIQTQLGTKMANPMTTGGDVIYGGGSGAPTRLANGTNGQVLTSAGTTVAPTWETIAAGGDVSKSGNLVSDSLVVGAGASSIKDLPMTAQSIPIALTANSISSMAVTEQTIVGRKTGGNVDNLSATEVKTILALENVENTALSTGQAGTVATITGLAPDTATTQATQAAITSAANLATVGTIGTGAWEGTAINQTYLVGQSGTNTGDEVVATGAELTTGTDDVKYASAKAIKDSHNVPSVAPSTDGNVMTSNGTNWISETPATVPVKATGAEIDTGTDDAKFATPKAIYDSQANVRWLSFNLVEAGTACATATNIGGDFVSPIAGTILQSDTTPFYLYATNSTAGTTGTMVVDISLNDTSIMTTNKLDFDTTEKTTTTAATPPDLTDTTIAVGDIIRIDIDSVHTTAAKGLTVYMAVRE